jgi:hypothetical protein
MKFLAIFLCLFLSAYVFGQNYGLNEIINFDEQAILRNDIMSLQQSSHDPAGGNDDGFSKGNFPGSYNSENIMLHAIGKGIVNRIWLTGYNSSDKLRIYFDGESFPTVDETVESFFSGTKAPFLTPLAVNHEVSSGGFVSYLPFTFEKSIMITTTGNHFYNINYQIFESNNTEIKTWSGMENHSRAYQILENRGFDPRVDEKYSNVSKTVNIDGGETKTVLKIDDYNQSISRLLLRIPEMEFVPLHSTTTTDNGKATTGFSQFTLEIDPNATSVMLSRRMDYWVADQKANVFIDEEYAGEWHTPGENSIYRWKNAAFAIPEDLTKEKSQISVRIEFVSSMIDWNEFYYWVYCDGSLTDEIDIGNLESEIAHSYFIHPLSWSGSLNSEYAKSHTDKGRAHKGFSEFNLQIDPSAEEFKLLRRMDFGVANQKARVFVNGREAGIWFTEGMSNQYRWADKEFSIPKNCIPEGVENVRVRVEFISSDVDWNEFYYWMVCDNICTDEINIGDESDESYHDYIITNQVWEGIVDYFYSAEQYRKGNLLKNLTMQIFFDQEEEPSVDAPAGLFFGTGTMMNSRFQSLPVGVTDNQDALYCYFPMPFKNSCEIKLVNNNRIALEGLNLEVSVKAVSEDFIKAAGYFKTQYNREDPPRVNRDYSLLSASGKGKFVGVVLEVKNAVNNLWLEGDERFYVDGCRTPSHYGTGTEDYFNGAWYFNRGPFDLATHGFTAVNGADRTLYRFHLSDPVYFNQKINLGIEHGPVNDVFADYESLAFYYMVDESSLFLTDEVNIGNNSSELDHKYQISGDALKQNSRSYQFEGDFDTEFVSETGYYISGSSEFEVSVVPGKPVRIKRMFDYAIKDQRADVYVDDHLVGKWYSNGSNTIKRWREEFFMVPADFIQNKSKIKLRFEAESGHYTWSEFYYWIYSVGNNNTFNSSDIISGDILVYPNPTERFFKISANEDKIKSVRVTDLLGRTIIHEQSDLEVIDLYNHERGVYYVIIMSEKGVHSTTIIKL